MSDRPGLRPQEAVGASLRGIARDILASARAAIEDKDRIEAVAVHDFRAAMKAWRGYLRLIEPFLDEEDRRWRTEARDLAGALAGARDCQAALDAAADLEKTPPRIDCRPVPGTPSAADSSRCERQRRPRV